MPELEIDECSPECRDICGLEKNVGGSHRDFVPGCVGGITGKHDDPVLDACGISSMYLGTYYTQDPLLSFWR